MLLTDFSDLIAARLRAEHRTLAARWLDRLLDLLPVEARQVFPSDSLLDHVPALILQISVYVADPEKEAIAANTAVLDKARELGTLRHAQEASLHQVVREYQLLAGVLVTFVIEEVERLPEPPPVADTIRLVSHLYRAVDVLSQVTIETFVSLYLQTIADQTERLEQFTRMATHEWRQPLGALQFGIAVLRRPDLDPARTQHTLDTLERSVQHLIELTRNVETMARMHGTADSPAIQEVAIDSIAAEAARQVREMADARGVTVRVVSPAPTIAVDVGRLELVFVNLLSNAIKYADSAKPMRFVEISAFPAESGTCRIHVTDNGVGIPSSSLATVFGRFTRAHADHEALSHVGGLGLGLSIVEDCIRSMGGEITLESVEHEGTTFTIEIPARPPES